MRVYVESAVPASSDWFSGARPDMLGIDDHRIDLTRPDGATLWIFPMFAASPEAGPVLTNDDALLPRESDLLIGPSCGDRHRVPAISRHGRWLQRQ